MLWQQTRVKSPLIRSVLIEFSGWVFFGSEFVALVQHIRLLKRNMFAYVCYILMCNIRNDN